MNGAVNFARTPQQRRRARELRFYRWLAGAALLGILPALALAWRIDLHRGSLDAANRLLEEELRALQPQLEQAALAARAIAAMQTRLNALGRQELRRAQAVRLLLAAATAASSDIALTRIALQQRRAELRGHAGQARAVQAFAEALANAGLEGVAIGDLRVMNKDDKEAEAGGYEFSLWLPLPGDEPAAGAGGAR
jgi:Tfp pilus assembly protein PilN